jgi:hypothetical protein
LTSYSDEPFVSTHGKELSGARTKAIEVEGERRSADQRLARHHCDRAARLDLTLMLDLLRSSRTRIGGAS